MYKHLSLEVLNNLDLVDPELGSQLMALFLTELPQHQNKIEKLKSSVTSYEFGKAVHALKGSIAVFGCAHLCSQLKDVELLAKDNKFDQAEKIYKTSEVYLAELVCEIDTYLQQKAA